MMVEAQIRAKLRALIEPIDGLAGHVVFDQEDIPDAMTGYWVSVNCGDEVIDQITLGTPSSGAKQAHTLTVNVDVFYIASGSALQEAEALLEVIIPRVFADRTLGGLVRSFIATGKARDKDSSGARVARLRLSCQTVFQTFDRDPTTSV